MKHLFAAALVLLSAAGHAATVRPDAFLCEGENEVTIPARGGWTQNGGALLMQVAANSVMFAEGEVKVAQALGTLAVKEEAIQSARFRNSGGGYAARGNAAAADENSATSKLAKYRLMVATCAASGPAPIEATVLESRPISGTARVRMPFNGAPAEVWVRRQDLSD